MNPLTAKTIELLKTLPKGLFVDLGAGTGALGLTARELGFEPILVDKKPAPEGIAPMWAERDVREFHIPDGAQCIHARNLLQFMTEVEGRALLVHAVNRLATGGVLAVEAFTKPPEPTFGKPHASHWTLADFETLGLEPILATETVEIGRDFSGTERTFFVTRFVARKK